jgi:RNase P subunit RPR2
MNSINLKGKITSWPDTEEIACDHCERALRANDRVVTIALRVTPSGGSVKSYVHWTCRRGRQTLVNKV